MNRTIGWAVCVASVVNTFVLFMAHSLLAAPPIAYNNWLELGMVIMIIIAFVSLCNCVSAELWHRKNQDK